MFFFNFMPLKILFYIAAIHGGNKGCQIDKNSVVMFDGNPTPFLHVQYHDAAHLSKRAGLSNSHYSTTFVRIKYIWLPLHRNIWNQFYALIFNHSKTVPNQMLIIWFSTRTHQLAHITLPPFFSILFCLVEEFWITAMF